MKGGSSGVKDLARNALAVDDSWSFTVAAATDTTAPTVASVIPTDGATGVAASANASAVFSEGMDSTSISGSTFGLVKEGTIVSLAASIAYDATSKTATLDPNLDLEAGARYTATVKGGAGGVKDAAGNALAQDKVWSFIIAPPLARDFFARTVSGGWGTAEVGGAWSILNGAASNFAVNGSQATLNTPKGGAQQAAHLGSLSARDLDARVQLTVLTALNGSRNLVTYLLLRNQSSGTHYRIGLVLTPRDELFIRGETGVGTRLFADVDTALRFTPGNTFVLRVQVQGGSPTTIRARVWRSGAPEPSPWAIVHSDATAALQTAGSVGIRMINESNTAVRVELDDFLVARLP
ncbi:MAG: Ig-like domain-containing protein [Actinobacteria bacterium]|nr:Ig-like domain-containing protein [Actinomycetota bacterium]